MNMSNMKRALITMAILSVVFSLLLLSVTGMTQKTWSIAVILAMFASLLEGIIRAVSDKGCGGKCKCKDKNVLNG